MEKLLQELRRVFKGEILTDRATRTTYSHDASIYEMVPDAVLMPENVTDIKHTVQFVTEHKHAYPALSITTRSAGTDMSGAAIGNSLTIDMTKHFSCIHGFEHDILHAQPGVFMRDVDPLLRERQLMIGCVPASRAWCTLGGMVGNNSGGEQSLRYGNTERSIRELKVVFADGNEYVVKPLTRRQLDSKIHQSDFEGELYRRVYELIEANYDLIKEARPKVNKNSMGYNLWSVWDRDTGIFDMTRLITGSQGTLGIVTDVKIQTHPQPRHSGLLLVYLTSPSHLDEIIPLIMEHKPATFEGFDDITFNLGIKYFSMFRKQLGIKEWLKQQAMLLGSVAKFRGHIPAIVLMVEFEGNSQSDVARRLQDLKRDLDNHHIRLKTDIEDNEEKSKPFWEIRRAGLALLRNKIKHRYASPFMDDMAVQPRHIPKFLPEVRRVIRKYKLPVAIQGHFGDGNFHIFPLLDIEHHPDQAKLEPAMRDLIPIVHKYDGTMAGEHNDGMIRGPWLPAIFGDEMYHIFRHTKEIFDPMYIFNPHKKTDASWDFSMSHIRTNKKRNLIK